MICETLKRLGSRTYIRRGSGVLPREKKSSLVKNGVNLRGLMVLKLRKARFFKLPLKSR